MIKNCLFCGKQFNKKGTKYKYCCHKCSSDDKIGSKFTLEHRRKISKSLVGHIVSEKSVKKLNEYIKNNGPWNKGKKDPQQSKEKHWHWRGGVTGQRKMMMNTLEYKNWRSSVFKRDNYICVWCGNKTSGNIEADHIKKWIDYPELRYDINNGRTLCKKCHKLTDTYGKQKQSEVHSGL
jgi:hypothetical protein